MTYKETRNLNQECVGFSGQIKALSGDIIVVERLYELGLLPGENIRLCAKMIFGAPLIVEFGSITIALRNEEAECIEI